MPLTIRDFKNAWLGPGGAIVRAMPEKRGPFVEKALEVFNRIAQDMGDPDTLPDDTLLTPGVADLLDELRVIRDSILRPE